MKTVLDIERELQLRKKIESLKVQVATLQEENAKLKSQNTGDRIELDEAEYWSRKIEFAADIAREAGYDEVNEECLRYWPCLVTSLLIKVSGRVFPYTIRMK